MASKDSQWFFHLQIVDVEVVAVVEDPDSVEDARRGPVVEADAAPVEHVVEHAENRKQLMKVVFVTHFVRLVQAWTTSGPRATYGPPSTLMWPTSYIWSFLNRYFDTLNVKKVPVLWQKNNLKISLQGHVLARGSLTCLSCGPRSQKSCPPLV